MSGFSSHLFWDCDARTIDFAVHARFVIGRVLARGTLADWREVKRRYPIERIREEVVRLRDLDPKARAFCALVLNLPTESFPCSKNSFLTTAR